MIDDCRADEMKYQGLPEGLRHLVKGTLYEGQEPVRLARRVAECMEEVRSHWNAD